MKTQSICLIIMALAGALIAGDPDSGKAFYDSQCYFRNNETGEHFLYDDTIFLEIGEQINFTLEAYSKGTDPWTGGCYCSPTSMYTVTKANNDQFSYWNQYILLDSVNNILGINQEFEGIAYIQYVKLSGGIISGTCGGVLLKISPPDTGDTSIPHSEVVGIFKKDENSETPLDTLILNTNDSVELSFKRKSTADGWINADADATWHINYCGKNEEAGINLGPVSCNRAGTGTITATSVDNPEVTVTITVIFEEPVSAVQPPHVLKSKPVPVRAIPDRGIMADLVLDGSRTVHFEVYNYLGKRVSALSFRFTGAGKHSVLIASKKELPPGPYVVRIRTGEETVSRTVLLTR